MIAVYYQFLHKNGVTLGTVAYTFNPSNWKAEAGGSRVPGQPGTVTKIK
jgi:hypothetical protein